MKNIYQNLPEKPGVYFFKDEHSEVLYVGKANNLKKRVSSYFSSKLKNRPWTAVMVGLARNIETIVVNNELEALMLEAANIKKYMPRFNILLTDDKSYPYIKLTVNETYPRLQIIRKHLKDGSEYFGPYLSAKAANLTCEFLRKLYGVHITSKAINPNQNRSCLNCQLENNLCPYNDEISVERYMLFVNKARDFLLGKRKDLIQDVREKMEIASSNLQYELAGKLRDRLKALQHITERQQVISTTLDDYDAIGVAKSAETAVVAVLRIREGRVNGQNHYFFSTSSGQGVSEVMRQFITSVYQHFSNQPPLIVLAVPIDDQLLIEKWLTDLRGGRVELRVGQRGEKSDLAEMANKNAQAKLESRILSQDSGASSLIALKNLLVLHMIPERIECIDISNLGSSEPVGASICFINGKPDKNEYRRYKINSIVGQNDFGMIEEVVRRRLTDNTRPFPDLLVIDGGPEQLKAAVTAAEFRIKNKELRGNNSMKIISLAKKPDRVFIPGRKLPLKVASRDKGMMLLSRIRDETHRYVIGFHRYRQNKKSLQVNSDQ